MGSIIVYHVRAEHSNQLIYALHAPYIMLCRLYPRLNLMLSMHSMAIMVMSISGTMAVIAPLKFPMLTIKVSVASTETKNEQVEVPL